MNIATLTERIEKAKEIYGLTGPAESEINALRDSYIKIYKSYVAKLGTRGGPAQPALLAYNDWSNDAASAVRNRYLFTEAFYIATAVIIWMVGRVPRQTFMEAAGRVEAFNQTIKGINYAIDNYIKQPKATTRRPVAPPSSGCGQTYRPVTNGCGGASSQFRRQPPSSGCGGGGSYGVASHC